MPHNSLDSKNKTRWILISQTKQTEFHIAAINTELLCFKQSASIWQSWIWMVVWTTGLAIAFREHFILHLLHLQQSGAFVFLSSTMVTCVLCPMMHFLPQLDCEPSPTSKDARVYQTTPDSRDRTQEIWLQNRFYQFLLWRHEDLLIYIRVSSLCYRQRHLGLGPKDLYTITTIVTSDKRTLRFVQSGRAGDRVQE